MTTHRIVVHPERPPGVWEALRNLAEVRPLELVDAADSDEVADALRMPDSVLATYRWSPTYLQAGLSWVQAMSSGVDQFPVQAFGALGIPLCSARGVLAECIAEHAMACLLALSRNLHLLRDDQHARRWSPRIGDELSGRTLGILGLGAVGQQVARRAKAFDLSVLGMRRVPSSVAFVDEVLSPARLSELCERSDALVVCLPGGDSTRGLVGDSQLAALGAGWLINVGRGSVVDESALLTALQHGELRGAALDVVDLEPPPQDSSLWTEPRVLLTSHSAVLSPRWGAAWTELLSSNLDAATAAAPWQNRLV